MFTRPLLTEISATNNIKRVKQKTHQDHFAVAGILKSSDDLDKTYLVSQQLLSCITDEI